MKTQPSDHTRRSPGADTRTQLLAAAGQVFERRGYRAASVGAITEQAGTAHGTFYLYFCNKDDVFCQVVESVVVDQLASSVTAPDGARLQRIDGGIAGFVDVLRRHQGLWEALLEGMLQSTRVQELWLRLRRDLVARLADGLRDEQEAGRLRALDAVLVAHALASMVEWAAFTHLSLGEPGGSDPDPTALVATLADLWRHALYGPVGDTPAG